MLHLLLTSLLALFAVSCGGPQYVDYFPYHDDGTLKPRVALLPVIDSSKSGLSWNVSEELSQSIYYDLMNCGEIYVASPEEIGSVWSKRKSIDFFGTDMSYAKEFKNTDFIVAMELIEHSVQPEDKGFTCTQKPIPCCPCNQILSVKIRLKVIDIRCEGPHTLLYEIVKVDYTIPPQTDVSDYDEPCWGSQGYTLKPCGIAHQRIVCALSKRLEEVLWGAK